MWLKLLRLLAASWVVMLGVNSMAADDMSFSPARPDLALRGYDVVAYFTRSAPVPGIRKFSVQHEGLTYQFASAKNLARFVKNPERFMPQYGGYCAYGVRVGKKIAADPTVWAILDGKLYLYLDPGTQRVWNRDPAKNVAIANRLWPAIRAIPADQLS